MEVPAFSYYNMGGSYLSTYMLQWILLIAAFLVTAIASATMKSTFRKYQSIQSSANLTGAQAAHEILEHAGISMMPVQPISGQLTDHYDPSKKCVSLGEESYQRTSVAAIAVAAHECGHAMQDHEGYFPLRLRTAIVPVANIGSSISWPLIIVGLIFSLPVIARIGVWLFTLVVIFQLVTLPVEFNASHRALKTIQDMGIVNASELSASKKVLTAAAMTYVAALASSIMQLARLMLLTRRSD